MLFALLEKACVLVTITFVLTRTHFFAHLLHPRQPIRQQVTALLAFILMAFTELALANHQGDLMNARIVAVCAAGLIAGPWVGGIVGLTVTVLACIAHSSTPLSIIVSMLLAGVAGGVIHVRRPSLALRPTTGFALGLLISFLRYGLAVALPGDPHLWKSPSSFGMTCAESTVQGLGVALILLVIAQMRAQETQARAMAMAEIRALQARMDPHFLFNALNTLAALSLLDPRAIPGVAARLGLFVRASLNQHDRPLISLQEELDVTEAYLEIESLRFGDRLAVEKVIDPDLQSASVPPFLLQPLVENAVQHGIQTREKGGWIRVSAHRDVSWLVLSVSDSGVGISQEECGRLFHSEDGHAHALALLRRRLQRMYEGAFRLTVESRFGEGTTVTVRIPFEQVAARTVRGAGTGTPPESVDSDRCTTVLVR